MNIRLFPRAGFAFIALSSVALLGYAYYAQFVQGYEPCPLCILQRFAFMITAIGALAGAVHGSRGSMRWLYGAIVACGSLWGIATAGRQLWLQSLPAEAVPDCGPGFAFMVEFFSVFEAIREAFVGSGECAEVKWSFLGISMAGWTMVWYVLFMAILIFALRKPRT